MSVREERHRLRTSFEEVPELYDRARPRYPAALLDDLVALAELPDGGRILEIGCGTGQASVPLAARVYELVCVELGERLAALAAAKLAPYPRATVVNASFEAWDPGDAPPFDAVVAFTSFHWLDPEIRFAKPAALLRQGGALAVVATQNVVDEGGDPFWAEVQEDYDAVVPSDDNRPPPRPDEVGDLAEEFRTSERFRPAAVRRHLWDVEYTAEEYVAVLDTYSGHRSIDPQRRRRLYKRIRRRIEARPGGTVTKTYLATLTLARRP